LNSTLFDLAERFCQRLVIVKNFGMINYLRVYENFHANMQLRLTDAPIIDLRIVNPWPELAEFCDQINLEGMEEIKHKHTPFLVIVYKALQIFKANVRELI
jgi:amyloid beta precursor protein binding protein 1